MDMMVLYLSKDGTLIDMDEESGRPYIYAKMIAFSRVRDKNSGKEILLAKLYDKYDDPEPYAVTSCGLMDIHGDLLALREFGFLLQRKNIQHLARLIEERFLDMSVTIYDGARTLQDDVYDILRFICEHIQDSNITPRIVRNNQVYCIPVEDFSRALKQSRYARYRITDVRRILCEMEYTICSPGRYDYAVKDEYKKPVKVIAINADATDVADIMQEIGYDCNVVKVG